MNPDLPEAARAFVEADVALLPSALLAEEVERLVAYLVERGDSERLQRLAEAPDKKLGKPARRALHLLRTRGHDLAAPAKREFRLHGPYVPEREPDGLVSFIDGHGERVVWLVRPASDGFNVHQVELSETHGLIGFQSGSPSKKAWRQHSESVVNDASRVVARAPHEHVRWLVEEGYERTIAAGRTPPESFAHARLDLGPLAKPSQHPARQFAPLEGEVDSVGLQALPEIALWVPPEEVLQKLDLELGQIVTSSLVVSAGGREEQMARIMEKLAGELTPQFRALIADRLDETALLFASRADVDHARQCVTVAARLRDPALVDPFLVQLFAKLIKKETP